MNTHGDIIMNSLLSWANKISEILDKVNKKTVETGDILIITHNNIRDGFLLCNGANVSRTDYADLFSVIGTTFGAGDGSTTFTLPDMRNRYPIGAGTNLLGAYLEEQLPNVSGNLGPSRTLHKRGGSGSFAISGAFSSSSLSNVKVLGSSDYQEDVYGYKIDASRSNSAYTNSGKVRPLSLVLNYVIKY